MRVLLRGSSSLEGKNELFVGKKEEKAVSLTQVRQTITRVKFSTTPSDGK